MTRLDLSSLNPPQRQAVEHFAGPMLVLAGAGSGKTRVLTYRAAFLVDRHGVAPSNILAVTFTNKAADEMRERIAALLGVRAHGLQVGTFHAIAARLLRRYAGYLQPVRDDKGQVHAWSSTFQIYDADDAERVVRRILVDDLRLDPKRFVPRSVHATISFAKNHLRTAADLARDADLSGDHYLLQVARVFERYEWALARANALDFDDLLIKLVEVARHEGVRVRLRERFRFLLVDEFQDTNPAQYAFLRELAAPERGGHGNLFVVGDDDQSIYRWRGADPSLILRFDEDFPTAVVVKLEQNYRSTGRILRAANEIIRHNTTRRGKTLWTANPEGEPVRIVELADEAAEAAWIVEEIERARREEGRSLRDFAVLYRTNAQSRPLEEALRRAGLPYRLIGGVRFYERREVKDVLAYLRLVANPKDDEAFRRAIGWPARGIGDKTLEAVARWAEREGVGLLEAARRASDVPDLRPSARQALANFAGAIAKWAAVAAQGERIETLLRELLTDGGLWDALRLEDDAEDRLRNIDALVAGAADFDRLWESGDPRVRGLLVDDEEDGGALRRLDAFLAQAALLASVDSYDPTADAVVLMTLHAAKGLEFDVVFIAGLEEGIFPLGRAYDEPEDLEEERRLFYVGVTRARHRLALTWARRRRRGGEWLPSVPSGFLQALPDDVVERLRPGDAGDRRPRPWSWAGPRRSVERPALDVRRGAIGSARFGWMDPDEADCEVASASFVDTDAWGPIRVGVEVEHPQFGRGRVRALRARGGDARAVIEFEDVGEKTVVLRYANLVVLE